MIRVVDTSALYALFLGEDAHHDKARRAFSTGFFLVPAEILAETVALAHYRLGPQQGATVAAAIAKLPGVEVQPTWDAVLELAQGIYAQEHRRLSFPDSIVVAWCRHRRLKPLAFDKRIEAAVAA